ncbi:polysaccharide biosynthesis/export family protein [Novosphingobium resinovorum]|uniref:polysaccharide biosynthesis/export family protein n=1 Tax=Novosphingobium resinovorum TaxID=158500 RepID=UPI002ED3EE26|nr:polysaccharide biosynthesis/export family protein [Novosphingobium resinovorum]
MPETKSLALLGTILSCMALTACATSTTNPDLPTGPAAYQLIPATVIKPAAYAIRPKDKLNLRVFGEAEISSPDLLVDEAGFIQVPLIGSVQAAGRSTPEVASEITDRLNRSYLVNPQVSVAVSLLAPRYVSVEGEVKSPGVYEIDGNTTLLSTLARAQSPTETARLSEVVVFRTVGEQRLVARFNLKDIRTGIAADPTILDGDVVMVGFSPIRGIVMNVLKATPLLNTFLIIARR